MTALYFTINSIYATNRSGRNYKIGEHKGYDLEVYTYEFNNHNPSLSIRLQTIPNVNFIKQAINKLLKTNFNKITEDYMDWIKVKI